MNVKASICTLAIALLAFGAPAWAAKVKVCHVPPGNPANFHTITVDDNAVQAHLAHGDILGSCAAHCDQLCDDGNACTIDACDANEHCLLNHPPVSCDDGNACTIDTCDPAAGCSSTPKVCQDTDLCTVNTCDPLTGACAFPPVSCPAGQACNASNGSCETTAVTCPCVTDYPGFIDALNAPVLVCQAQTAPDLDFVALQSQAAVWPFAGFFSGLWFCGDALHDPAVHPITEQQGKACIDLLKQRAAAAGVICQNLEGPAG